MISVRISVDCWYLVKSLVRSACCRSLLSELQIEGMILISDLKVLTICSEPFVVGTHLNCLIKTIQMSTHNIGFH